jgi:hypothetical protein
MILVDEHEPLDILKLIKQSAPAQFHPLNRAHRSDYFFQNFEGKTFQYSRKQAGELIGDMDEAERQIADYYNQADYNFQIVEGWISPLPIKGIEIKDHSAVRASIRELGQKLYCYHIQPNGKVDVGHSFSTASISMLYAWEHRLSMCGVQTFYTLNWVETARRLVIEYKNELKPPEEHTTLRRVIVPRAPVVDEKKMTDAERSEYRLMKALIFLSDAYKIGVGEKRARALAKEYVNLMDIACATPEQLASCENMGAATAKKLLAALGRTI